MPRELYKSKAQQEFFTLLGDPKNVTASIMADIFARHKKSPPKFYQDDLIMIGPEQSKFVKKDSITTIGIYIANKFLYEDLEIFGYINKELTGDMLSKIDNQVARALLSNDVTREKVGEWIDRCQFLYGGPLAHIINTSLSETILNLPPTSRKLLNKLLEENKEGLDANDPEVSSKIEKEVVKNALEEMHKTNDPALALYDSGCGVDPYNNYRTMFVMKGAIVDNTGESPTGYKIVKSNYNDGVSKEDLPIIADSLVTSAYSKGVATQDAGTSAKRYNAIFQRIKLLQKGTDCGSTKTLPILITDDNKLDYEYRYIIENGKLVMLTSENLSNYVGKVVQLRSGLYCESPDPGYCNICAGDRQYRIGTKNIGLTFNIVAGSMLNANMKKFHDISIKLYTLDDDAITKYMKYPAK